MQRVWNVPNILTGLRIILAIAMFVLMANQLYIVSLAVFLVAAGTDWLDGWYARRYELVTVLGRIADPFADKLIVCGAFIYLAAEPVMQQLDGGLRAWMVVLVVSRELLVTALRGMIEGQGGDFSASMSGKLKMVFQCAAIAICLVYLAVADQAGATVLPLIRSATIVTVWLMVLLTAYSGYVYIRAAIAAARPEGSS